MAATLVLAAVLLSPGVARAGEAAAYPPYPVPGAVGEGPREDSVVGAAGGRLRLSGDRASAALQATAEYYLRSRLSGRLTAVVPVLPPPGSWAPAASTLGGVAVHALPGRALDAYAFVDAGVDWTFGGTLSTAVQPALEAGGGLQLFLADLVVARVEAGGHLATRARADGTWSDGSHGLASASLGIFF